MDDSENRLKAKEAQLLAREEELRDREERIAQQELHGGKQRRGNLYDKVTIPIPVLNGIILALLAVIVALFLLNAK